MMGMFRDLAQCLFCDQPVKDHRPVDQPQVHHVQCPGCTRYVIDFETIGELQDHPLDARQKANASGWLREHPETQIGMPEIKMLRDLPTLDNLDRSIALFDLIALACPKVGEWYEFEFVTPAFRSAARTESAQELEYLVSEYLVLQLKFLERHEDVVHEQFIMIRITPRGWDVVEQRRNPPPVPKPPLGFTSSR
jgi:hypothetical protein